MHLCRLLHLCLAFSLALLSTSVYSSQPETLNLNDHLENEGISIANAHESVDPEINQESIGTDFLFSGDQYDELYHLEQINLYGLKLLFLEQFDEALLHFNRILTSLHENCKLDEPLFGAALWGRLLCHAYSDLESETFNDLAMIRSHFIKRNCHPCFDRNSNYRISLTADYVNPNEKLSPADCKERVRGTANIMRILVAKVQNRVLANALNFTIAELEYAASQCCDRTHWTECLNPIVNSWKYLKNCLDKGAAISPNLASPGR